MPNAYQYLFGPVPSRRLGRSLGVDLIPFKTCTMDCIYCQLGETPCAVSERDDYVPMQDVLAELERWKKADGQADHITLAGSGEPTLHTRFGDVFRWVKAQTDIQSVLLTNGTLLHFPEVREEAGLADQVKVTLSAWDEASFQQIHRPAQGVTFDLLVQGNVPFAKGIPVNSRWRCSSLPESIPSFPRSGKLRKSCSRFIPTGLISTRLFGRRR